MQQANTHIHPNTHTFVMQRHVRLLYSESSLNCMPRTHTNRHSDSFPPTNPPVSLCFPLLSVSQSLSGRAQWFTSTVSKLLSASSSVSQTNSMDSFFIIIHVHPLHPNHIPNFCFFLPFLSLCFCFTPCTLCCLSFSSICFVLCLSITNDARSSKCEGNDEEEDFWF